jgi:nuclear transport factor 2 (NTF2) superfamily protein
MAHITPPFTADTALEKVKFAQNAWNSKDPATIAKG